MRSATLVEAARADGTGTRTASVLGLGHHLPETVVSNRPIAQRLDIDEGWIDPGTIPSGGEGTNAFAPHRPVEHRLVGSSCRALGEDVGKHVAQHVSPVEEAARPSERAHRREEP